MKKNFEQPPYPISVELDKQTELRCLPPLGVPTPKVYWLKNGAALLNAITCPSGSGVRGSRGQREVVRLCRLLPDERPCPTNIRFYYLFKGCFHDTAISNPAWQGHKIIAGLFGRMCFIWHILGMAVQRRKIKL